MCQLALSGSRLVARRVFALALCQLRAGCVLCLLFAGYVLAKCLLAASGTAAGGEDAGGPGSGGEAAGGAAAGGEDRLRGRRPLKLRAAQLAAIVGSASAVDLQL